MYLFIYIIFICLYICLFIKSLNTQHICHSVSMNLLCFCSLRASGYGAAPQYTRGSHNVESRATKCASARPKPQCRISGYKECIRRPPPCCQQCPQSLGAGSKRQVVAGVCRQLIAPRPNLDVRHQMFQDEAAARNA